MMRISKTFSRRAVVHVAKPKKEAKRSVEKGSKRKESGEKVERSAGSGRGVAEVKKPAKDLKPKGGASAISALHPVVENSLPVASELAKILGLPEDQDTPQQLSFPVYGNYCGFGHGDPTGNTPPIDAVDAVCRQHDLCYRLLGDFDCQCDRHFIEIMPSAIASTPSPIGKHAGFLALLYFSLAERNLALGETLVKRT
jgi:hypothetical protein